MANATAGMIAMQLRLDRARTSASPPRAPPSANAIGEAAALIRDGSADVVMAGGTEACITPTAIAAFARMGALSTRNDDPDARVAPVRRRPRRLRDGRRRGVRSCSSAGTARWPAAPRIYGEVVGLRPQRRRVPHHRAVARRRGRGRVHAARARRRRPRRRRRSGTSTRTARRRRSTTRPRPRRSARCSATPPPPVTSTKGVTGHLIGARRRGRGGRIACSSLARRRGAAHREPRAASATTSASTSSPASRGRSRRSRRCRTRSGSAATTRRLILGPVDVDAPVTAPHARRRAPQRRRDRPSCARSTAARSAGSASTGGKHHGAIGTAGGRRVDRAVQPGRRARDPARRRARHLGRRPRARASPRSTRWGRIAKALARRVGRRARSLLAVIGPCVSGPALLLGLADHVVVMTDRRVRLRHRARLGRAEFTGVAVDRPTLGGAAVHDRASGVASLVVADEDDALDARRRRCSRTCRRHHLDDPPLVDDRRPDRPACDARRRRGAGAADRVVRRAHGHRRRARRRLASSSCGRLRAEHGHRPRPPRRPAGRRRREPADAPRRHPRHRGVAQGGPLRAVVRRVQLADHHVRRHARLRARAATSSGGA